MIVARHSDRDDGHFSQNENCCTNPDYAASGSIRATKLKFNGTLSNISL